MVGAEQFSLITLVRDAHIIEQVVMAGLLVLSVWTWAIAIDKWATLSDMKSRAAVFEKTFWSGQAIDDLDQSVSDRPRDAMARVFAVGAREYRDMRRATSPPTAGALGLMQERIDRLMQAAIARELSRASQGLGILATIGSASPFIGLLGTVSGIMNAFLAIAREQQSDLATVAPGIAAALFATALGLFAAIPAVVFYNKFTADLERFGDQLEGFADEFAARISRRLGERV